MCYETRMSILKVARLGHPVLRKIAAPLSPREIQSPLFQKFIDDMIETMKEYDGVGLAADQVHESRQVAVLEVADNPRYPNKPNVPLTVLINPKISPLTDEMEEDWEGCLSIPDIRGRVPRHKSIQVRAFDRGGNRIEIRAQNFSARVIQHETDHLDGVLFFDRMKSFDTLTFLEEYSRYWTKEIG